MTSRAPGAPLADARLIRVTADLAHGAVLDPRWPLPLDGILASAVRRELHGDLYGGVRDLHVHPLPLAAWTRGAGARWWWLASCAAWPEAGEELRYWHRRVPHAQAERVTGDLLPPQIYEGHGRYRAYRMPLVVTLAARLEWMACGDPAAIRALLETVWCVGKKRSQGEGEVLRWTVDDLGAADPLAVMWHADGRISRPVPARAAAALGLDDPDTTAGAYRPPYWRPPEDHGQPGGDGPFARQWQEVIAPWTMRPPMPPCSATAASSARASRPGPS